MAPVEALGARMLYALAVAVYGLAAAQGVLLWRRGFRRGERLNHALLALGFVVHTAALVGRGFSLRRCPVTNLFEALMFVTWAICGVHVVAALWPRLKFVGVFLAPGLLTAGIFALQPQLDRPGPVFDLEHAAVSLHVSLVLLAYAGFALGAVAGGLFLLREAPAGNAPAGGGTATGPGSNWEVLAGRLPPIERLEEVLLRSVGTGLVLLTAGLVLSLGLMRERYGVLVRPDPKIAWSFLVWTVYFGLLLLRLGFRQATRRLAWGALAGFGFVVLTFWSTNLLSPIHHP
jgi:ABC-type transport system involved in cytochrome c biogenesis permease subunit